MAAIRSARCWLINRPCLGVESKNSRRSTLARVCARGMTSALGQRAEQRRCSSVPRSRLNGWTDERRSWCSRETSRKVTESDRMWPHCSSGRVVPSPPWTHGPSCSCTDKASPRYKNLYSSQVLAGSSPIAVQARTLNGIPPLQINKLFQFS